MTKFHYLDGTVEDVGVSWPLQPVWQLRGRLPINDISFVSDIMLLPEVPPISIHTFELVRLSDGRAAYFEGGLAQAKDLAEVAGSQLVAFRATRGEIVTVKPPTTFIESRAQQIRDGLAEIERERTANNPRVIVQPDYPDWDDGGY